MEQQPTNEAMLEDLIPSILEVPPQDRRAWLIGLRQLIDLYLEQTDDPKKSLPQGQRPID
jgi:hypothetical protein